jgi:hypothetical protein
MTQYNIAQLNIGRMTGININDPVMKEFKDQLDTINALAERTEGFVWRLKSEGGNATEFNPYSDDRIIVNFSVWESVDQLKNYVYRSAHTDVMRDRKKWFEKFGKPYYVLWYVNKGYIPTLEEAVERLEYLQQNGCTNAAFDFSNIFQPPGNNNI